MQIHRCSLRHATWMILAVWLFAMGAGVANACLLSERVNGGHSSFPAATSMPVAENHHGAQTDAGHAGCLKFCDEAPLAITKADQSIADGSSGWAGVLYRTTAPTTASATAVQLRVSVGRPGHIALPIASRPHRLTL